METTFRERWEDPAPLSRRPDYWLMDKIRRLDRTPDPLPPQQPPPPPVEGGTHVVQLLRTYPNLRQARDYPFAPGGERSVALGYAKAAKRSRRLVYVEDQYFWGNEIASTFLDSLVENPGLHLVCVLPLYPDLEGSSRTPQLLGRQRAIRDLMEAAPGPGGGVRPGERAGTPVYVHAKLCVMDDVWCTTGSDNFNRRSWTHDSELTAAVVDRADGSTSPYAQTAAAAAGRRAPRAGSTASLAGEDLARGDGRLPGAGGHGAAYAASADALDAWHARGRLGPRPPGQLRRLDVPDLPRPTRVWARFPLRVVQDPDGRPWRLRQQPPLLGPAAVQVLRLWPRSAAGPRVRLLAREKTCDDPQHLRSPSSPSRSPPPARWPSRPPPPPSRPPAATRPRPGCSWSTPSSRSDNQDLTDDKDAKSAVPMSAYATVPLNNLDGSGYLRGKWAYVESSTGTPAYSSKGQYFFTRDQDQFEQVMAYFWVDRAQTYLQSLGFDDIVHEPFHVKVGQYGGDNSYQTDKPYRIRLGKGGVDDAEDAEVIVHEYGHAVHQSQVPGYGQSADAGAIGESFGDYLAVTVGLDAAAPVRLAGRWRTRPARWTGTPRRTPTRRTASAASPRTCRRASRAACTSAARSGRRRCGRSAVTTSAWA